MVEEIKKKICSACERYASIDVLRGLAIVLMFVDHFPRYLLENMDSSFYMSTYFISRFAAPLFLVIAGMCFVLSAEKRRSLGEDENNIIRHISKRGLYIIMIGFVLNALTFKNFLAWNILHTIGFSMVLCLLLLRYRTISANIVVLLAVLLLYAFSGYAGFSVSIHDMMNYPPIPWVSFFIVGTMIGRLLLWSGDKEKDIFVEYMGYFSVILMAVSYVLAAAGDQFYPYPPTPIFIMIALSFIFSLFVVSFWSQETIKRCWGTPRFLTVLGKYSLSIYVLHLVFLSGLLALAGVNNKFGELETVGIMAAFSVVVFYSAERMETESRKIRSRILRIISFVCDRKPS